MDSAATTESERFYAPYVVRFTLPSTGEKWNWPVDGEDSVDVFAEILDRANISWEVRRASEHIDRL